LDRNVLYRKPFKSKERIEVITFRLIFRSLRFLDYKITDWKENAEGVLERVESYLFPLNNPLVRAKETECYVTIKLSKNVPGRYDGLKLYN